MNGAALCRHSSHSRSGSESAVMPPPTPRTALPAASNSTVRIATFSSHPATGDAKPCLEIDRRERFLMAHQLLESRQRAIDDSGDRVTECEAARVIPHTVR